jgi:hypothetical protein
VTGEDAKAGEHPRSRASIVVEMACLAGLGLLAWFWIIPIQISGGGIGLDPAFVPRACVGAIILLVLSDGVLLLLRNDRPSSYPANWWALALTGGAAILGAVVLMLAGATAAALVVIPVGMLALGERRLVLIAVTTAIVAIALKLFQI